MLEPTNRLGVYRTIDDVPTHDRLTNYHANYTGRDVFRELWDEQDIDPSNHAQRGAELWRNWMDNRGRHPALAHPDDVTGYASMMLDRYAETSLYNYGREPWKLYDWLLWHTDHPHSYNPLLMAAAADDTTYRLYYTVYDK